MTVTGLTAIAGELIQMNAHMIPTTATEVLWMLGLLAIVCGVTWLIIGMILNRFEWKRVLVMSVLVAIGVALIIVGDKQPRKRRIMACVNGPVSLEQIASVYEIKDVDGKMLTLIER